MNWKPAEKIANAVLYEGYLLYPYRPSALKNQRRWTFGATHPGVECLLEGTAESRLSVKVRFLQEFSSSIEERELLVEDLTLDRLLRDGEQREFSFPPLSAHFECRAEREAENLFKLVLRIENRSREESPSAALLSCHAVLAVEGGAFVSMTDPPEHARTPAARCEHRGLWPVLVGAPPDRTLALAAPIILSDYPNVAPESPRDLFDGTEIDEILTLRILTLSDEEKEEVRRGDERARRLLERTESLSREELLALHGRMSASKPPPGAITAGDLVRLRPRGRADIMDLALEGKEATVVSIEEDFEGRRYLAVAVNEDPGRDFARAGFPGHRFFFRLEEVEPL